MVFAETESATIATVENKDSFILFTMFLKNNAILPGYVTNLKYKSLMVEIITVFIIVIVVVFKSWLLTINYCIMCLLLHWSSSTIANSFHRTMSSEHNREWTGLQSSRSITRKHNV